MSSDINPDEIKALVDRAIEERQAAVRKEPELTVESVEAEVKAFLRAHPETLQLVTKILRGIKLKIERSMQGALKEAEAELFEPEDS